MAILETFHLLNHFNTVAMRRINHHGVHARLYQGNSAVIAIITNSRRRRDPQAPRLVFTSIGMIFGFFHIFDSHKPDTFLILIDNDKTFDTEFMQQ